MRYYLIKIGAQDAALLGRKRRRFRILAYRNVETWSLRHVALLPKAAPLKRDSGRRKITKEEAAMILFQCKGIL